MGVSLGTIGALAIIGFAIGIIAYQVLHRRAELAQLDLLGSWRDITKAQTAVIKTSKKSADQGSHASFDANALMEAADGTNTATVTALFHTNRVMLRVCEPEQVHINRTILGEIRAVRAIANDNVVKLEGLCTGPHRVAVMYSYCAKGSLAVSFSICYCVPHCTHFRLHPTELISDIGHQTSKTAQKGHRS